MIGDLGAQERGLAQGTFDTPVNSRMQPHDFVYGAFNRQHAEGKESDMARIEIFEYHCILESSWGRIAKFRNMRRENRSDEIAFFMAALPVDTLGSDRWTDWVYDDPSDPELRQKRIRSNFNVDSGEDKGWQYSISFEIDPRPNLVYELILQIYEIDGATSTSTQAQVIHDELWKNIQDKMRPGIRIGASPDLQGNSGPTTYEAAFQYCGYGRNDNLMFADVWHFDPNRPLLQFNIPSVGGGSDPDLQIRQQRSTRKIGAEVSRFPPDSDRVIERREYSTERYDARYRFDVHYTQ